ncbi:MAG: hypothetical protein COA37_15980 [Hoeflea sp.]|nr:MAG: hypothetical protein COA37_15980 [Hoeflea sp.]|tara:strand:- start:292 stop:474 length:183 start_codon:yes stop_codon:yes gene_type:complete
MFLLSSIRLYIARRELACLDFDQTARLFEQYPRQAAALPWPGESGMAHGLGCAASAPERI